MGTEEALFEKKQNIEIKNENISEKEEDNNLNKIELPSVQIISKQTFDKNRIIKIKELSNGRIGILFEDSLLIENIKTSKKIDEIKLPVIMHYDEGIFDFIELKNSQLILWSSETIYVYQMIDDKYNLYQNINESEEEREKRKQNEIDSYFGSKHKKYEINSIYELSNGNLVSCNSYGLKIYIKNNEKYILESKHDMEIDVRKIIEINNNQLILFQRYHYFWWGCSMNNYSSHTYSISTYDIETKKLNTLAKNKVTKDDYYGYVFISYIIKNGFLLVRYGNKIDIYDIKNNMLLVNHDQDSMIQIKEEFYGRYQILKDEMDIIFLCDYFDNFNNLFITKNLKNKFRIYLFENNSLKYVKDFQYELNEFKEIIKLKSNILLAYSDKELILLNQE